MILVLAAAILPSAATSDDVDAACIRDFTEGNADALFARFGAEMAKAVPREKNAAFLADLRRDQGDVKASRLLSTQRRGPVVTYNHEVRFERGTMIVSLSVDDKGNIGGMVVKPAPREDAAAARLDAYETRTTLSPPFRGEWTASNANRDASNPHFNNPNQRFAVDWVMVGTDGRTWRGEGTRNEDYLCHGQDMLAPADGTVVIVIDGVPECEPRRESDRYNVGGNQVVLDLGSGEYALFAHAIPGSIRVKQGDKVKRGQVLARVGNSGNSSEPHLHFQLSNDARLHRAQALPAKFSDVTLNGARAARAWPVEGDRMK